jgi:hypothetical protein
MKRWVLLALLLFSLETAPVRAHGFGLFRQPAEVRSAYYVPTVVYYVPVTPAPVWLPGPPVTIVPSQPLVIQSQPVVSQPFATPSVAPAATTEPPLASRKVSTGSTSMRVGEQFYQLLPGPVRMGKVGDTDLCSVAFWNLTNQTLALHVNGRDVSLAPNKSATLELPPTFAWQIQGREAEATRIPTDRGSAEILIRR